MREAQKNESGPKGKDQVKSKAADAWDHEGIKRPRRLEAQTKKHPEEKKKTTAGNKKSGSSTTIKRRGSFQAQSQRKTRTARKKKTEEENKKQSRRTQTPVKPSDLSWHRQKKTSGNQNRETQKKKRMITSSFQVGKTGFRPNGKEKGKVELPKW